jgi:hypothetical protein
MGLKHNSREIFSEAWVQAVRSAPESAMTASISLFRPSGIPPVYNSATGEYTSSPDTVLYTGLARVQPLRTASKRDNPGNETSVQQVLFSIPIANKAVDLRTDVQARVILCALNPALVTYRYHVSEVMDSSNPIERTFLCVVDQETQP